MKAPVRQVTIDVESEAFLKKNPHLNASLSYRQAIHAMMPKDNDIIRLNNLAVEISDLRAELAIK